MSIARNRQGILDDRSSRRLVVENLPFHYVVHLNEACNQRCIMCRPPGKTRGSVLPLESFVALFEQLKDHAEHLTLIGGEPLMHPQLPEVLELISRRPIAVTTITNAFMLNGRVTPGLLALHELNLKCSIDAATRSTYLRIRGTDHFDRVTANMRRFAASARDRPQTRVIPHYVVMRENLAEVIPFIDFARSLPAHRVEFVPVRQVASWRVENGTGWIFDGREQSVEFFRDEYNDVMRQAAAKCDREGLSYDIHPL